MRLKTLIERCGCFTGNGDLDPDISTVTTDSRSVRNGGLFIAVEGYKENGLKYVRDAVRRGAAAVVVEKRVADEVDVRELERARNGLNGERPNGPVALCTTANARTCALLASRAFYGFPSGGMTLIGVTGTNGKTTVTYMIEAILKAAGKNPGVVGTITYRFNEKSQKANNTTPDPVELQSLFAGMREGGVTHVVMEVSSHALAMDRVFVPDFTVAVFTNLSQDHLDFHKSMDEYFGAKARLFQGLPQNAWAIVNRDDPYGVKLLSLTRARCLSYGLRADADLRAEVVSLSVRGTRFTVNGRSFGIPLVGEHNVSNFLCAYGAARALGIDDGVVERALSGMGHVPGRFERVGDKGYHVFVDYAHTPDALQRLLDAANVLKRGRIITVFGCGGDRDRGKRPLMGSVVEKGSDVAVVTSDNPRTEDPLAIIEDIRKGLSGSNHVIIPDRKTAIFEAIGMARPDDIVLIAGKGHEDYQILKDRTIHFDDREVAAEAMREMGKF